MAAKAKHAVARVVRQEVAAPRKIIARLDLVEQRFHADLEERGAALARLDDKIDALREVLASGAGVTDEREKFFLRRLEAMERYGRGELQAGSTEETWVERDLAAEVPRSPLSVASSWGISRDLIEQVYAQYQAAYESAFRRWRDKYPTGAAPGRCHACGHALPESKPLPRMDPR